MKVYRKTDSGGNVCRHNHRTIRAALRCPHGGASVQRDVNNVVTLTMTGYRAVQQWEVIEEMRK